LINFSLISKMTFTILYWTALLVKVQLHTTT